MSKSIQKSNLSPISLPIKQIELILNKEELKSLHD